MNLAVFAATVGPLGLYAMAVPTPGPGLVVISRTSVRHGASNGAAAALGTTASVVIYAGATILGISALLATLPWLAILMQICGGAYLLYLGLALLRSGLLGRATANEMKQVAGAGHESHVSSFRRALIIALIIGLGNPKLAAFFLGLFSPAIGQSMPLVSRVIILAGIIMIDLVYHQIVAQVAARGKGVIGRFDRCGRVVLGGCMSVLGTTIVARALSRA